MHGHRKHGADADIFRENGEENKNFELSGVKKQGTTKGWGGEGDTFLCTSFLLPNSLEHHAFLASGPAGKRHATGQFFLTTAPTPDGLANPLRAYLICKLGTATLASSHPSGVPEHSLGALFHLYLLYLRLTKSDMRANM